MKKHKKHANLTRPNYGQFGRNEWAILGTPCGVIQKLGYDLTKELSEKWKVAYVDADHKSADGELENETSKNAISNNAFLEYTDKITHHRFESNAEMDSFQYRTYFNESDLVLVNGNHFKAKNQIVVIDPRKEDSLKRKLDSLTNVQLILLTDNVSEPFGFLKENIEGINEIPVVRLSDFHEIKEFLAHKMETAIPPLFGLVLAGGKSERMGRDKGQIDYHGKPQREYVHDLLTQFCEKTFLSFRDDQDEKTANDLPILKDSFSGLGPFGAILSAFRKYPNHAWLVVACDLPLLDKRTLKFLTENRNTSNIATAFHSPVTNFPEPLITIWEPKSYPVLYQFLAQGYSCPRKVLINSAIHLLEIPDSQAIKNVNTPTEFEEVKNILIDANLSD
ncbi:MAG: NTP transferase domain-containing protein [Saprospiraceae bacterium]|jgi:molybdopterin-guanine dinucleotide biosynthesis protein A|nr:NTP transferase domain-containing protein [Saprospiraceae bacterium]